VQVSACVFTAHASYSLGILLCVLVFHQRQGIEVEHTHTHTHTQVGAAVLGVMVKPTIKEVDSNGMVVKTLERSKLWEVQTPQV